MSWQRFGINILPQYSTENLSISIFARNNLAVENIVADYLFLARKLTYSLTIYDLNKIGKFQKNLALYAVLYQLKFIQNKTKKDSQLYKREQETSRSATEIYVMHLLMQKYKTEQQQKDIAESLKNLPILLNHRLSKNRSALSLGTNSQPRYFLLQLRDNKFFLRKLYKYFKKFFRNGP